MRAKKPSRRRLRGLCADVHPDDGLEPREWMKQGRSGRAGRRKAWQLCAQVAEALSEALAGDCGDDVLRNLQVVGVEPGPDGSRLLVTVRVDPPSDEVRPELVLERLAQASGRLRCAVAAAITRRRTPTLMYRLALPAGGESPGPG
jgi:ribosome-binding factor A